MNKNKTGVIWVGKLKYSKDKIEGIKWSEKLLKHWVYILVTIKKNVKNQTIIFKPPISKLPIIVFLLTLSGLPSHMNLKHLLSIYFLYLSGTTHALATKVNIGMTNALIMHLMK
jgi:hypothetical protein